MNKPLLTVLGALTVVTAGATVEAVRHQYGEPLLPHVIVKTSSTPIVVTPSPSPSLTPAPASGATVGVSATVVPVLTVSKPIITQLPEQRTDKILIVTTNSGTTAVDAQIVVTFYDAAGKALSSASTITTAISPNKSLSSTFYTSDLVDSYATVKAVATVAP